MRYAVRRARRAWIPSRPLQSDPSARPTLARGGASTPIASTPRRADPARRPSRPSWPSSDSLRLAARPSHFVDEYKNSPLRFKNLTDPHPSTSYAGSRFSNAEEEKHSEEAGFTIVGMDRTGKGGVDYAKTVRLADAGVPVSVNGVPLSRITPDSIAGLQMLGWGQAHRAHQHVFTNTALRATLLAAHRHFPRHLNFSIADYYSGPEHQGMADSMREHRVTLVRSTSTRAHHARVQQSAQPGLRSWLNGLLG